MEPLFIGQVAAFAFDFAPRGWAKCDGSLLNITSNPKLYEVLGTKFGGDGIDTFGLPDLRGRFVLGANSIIEEDEEVGYPVGLSGGATTVTQDITQVAGHSHPFNIYGNDADTATPATGTSLAIPMRPNPPAADVRLKAYKAASPVTTLNTDTIGTNSYFANPMPVLNPFQALTYCIAIAGDLPTEI